MKLPTELIVLCCIHNPAPRSIAELPLTEVLTRVTVDVERTNKPPPSIFALLSLIVQFAAVRVLCSTTSPPPLEAEFNLIEVPSPSTSDDDTAMIAPPSSAAELYSTALHDAVKALLDK
jgi:hypothetical protein